MTGHNVHTCRECRKRQDENRGRPIAEWWDAIDRQHGKPCLVCGAPISERGEGHDPGCMGLSE